MNGFDWLTLKRVYLIYPRSFVLDLYFWGEAFIDSLMRSLLRDKQRFGLGEFDVSILYSILPPSLGHN